jgi:hypothetical protein
MHFSKDDHKISILSTAHKTDAPTLIFLFFFKLISRLIVFYRLKSVSLISLIVENVTNTK